MFKRQGIAFFFDHSTDKEWKKLVHDGYDLSAQTHKQFKAITFVAQGLRERAESGDVEFLPLQAADMAVYRMRQQMEKIVDFAEPTTWRKLDDILFASMAKRRARLTDADINAAMRRVFIVPEDMSYEQAMQSLKEQYRRRI